MIDPFDNDHQSQQIGQLIIENQTDKVTVYGDIDITKTAIGLEQAQQLQQLFTKIVKELLIAKKANPELFAKSCADKSDQKDTAIKQNQSGKLIDNPFS